jgi:hypothetical protein
VGRLEIFLVVRLCVAEVVVAVVMGVVVMGEVVMGEVVTVAGSMVTEDAAVTKVAGEISSGHRGILPSRFICVMVCVCMLWFAVIMTLLYRCPSMPKGD